MATVRDILAEKGSHVLSIGEDASVLDAALLMNEHKIGGLPVLREGRVVGMFTERDILQRIVAEQRDPVKMSVGQTMTRKITTARIETTIDEARALMRNKRIRHLPILDDDGKPLGMISIGDLNAWLMEDQTKTVDALKDYLNGNSSMSFVL
ncbi:MAG: CBS domain-containing protein [Phycisphaeraceae bacterium]